MSGQYNAQAFPTVAAPQPQGQMISQQQMQMMQLLQQAQKRKLLAELLQNSGVTQPTQDQGP